MKDVLESFSIGDFTAKASNLTYSEFLCFSKSVLDGIENLNLSDNGLYKGKKNAVMYLYHFVKAAEMYVRSDGATAGGNSETEIAYLKTILCGIKKRHNLL